MANFFGEGMPLPAGDLVSQPFWDGCKEHKLLIQRCNRCGTYRMGPQPVCYVCRCFEWTWEESQGLGEVYTYTIVRHSVHPATADRIPYNSVIVQLRDCGGVRVPGNVVECANEDIKIGMPVKLVWEDVAEDVALPRWKPAS